MPNGDRPPEPASPAAVLAGALPSACRCGAEPGSPCSAPAGVHLGRVYAAFNAGDLGSAGLSRALRTAFRRSAFAEPMTLLDLSGSESPR